MQKKLLILLNILLLFALPQFIWAQSNEKYSVDFEIISGGTGNLTGILSNGAAIIEGTVSIMVDQPVITIETLTSGDYEIDLGFWSQLLRTPGTPTVHASYDTYPDHIELDWHYDPNDPPGTETHKIYRDFSSNQYAIADIPSGQTSFSDIDLPAGQQYEYLVQGSNRIQSVNTYQPIEDAGMAFGKTSSDGTIRGFINTGLNSPVPNVRVIAYNEAGTGPAWGNAAFLNGVGDYISLSDDDTFELLDQNVQVNTTLEFWFKPDVTGLQTLISKGSKWEFGMDLEGLNYVYLKMDDTEILASDHVLGSDEDQAISIDAWNHIALVREADQLKLYINGWLAQVNNGNEFVSVNQQIGSTDDLVLGNGLDNYRFRGLLDELRCWSEARDNMFMEPYSDVNNDGQYDELDYFTDINGDGYWGPSDSTAMRRDYNRLFDFIAEGVIVEPTLTACFHMNMGLGQTLINSANLNNNAALVGSWSGDQAPTYPSAYTDADGAYGIKNMNFGSGRAFRIVPEKSFHTFQPLYQTEYLNQTNPTKQVDFDVTNMISISGYVTYDSAGTEGTDCGEPNVEIWEDGAFKGVRTNEDGFFILEVEPGRTLTLKPKKGGRDNINFYPQTKTFFNVITPQSQSFVDDKTRTLRGSVTGGACELSLGPAGVAEIRLVASCFETSTLVDAAGNFAFANIAPMAYTLSVAMDTEMSGIPNLLEMDTYFSANGASFNAEESYDLMDSIWTTEEDTLNFNYRSPIKLRADGWTLNELSDYAFEQNGSDTLDIYVYEQYAGGECPVDTGVIYIKDWISDRYVDGDDLDGLTVNFAQDMENLEQPSLRYGLLPGLPRLDGDHKKNLELRASGPSGINTTDAEVYRAVVLGHRPNELDFATTAPEIPLLILRRPPGDGSWASFSESSSASTSFSLSLGSALSYEQSIQAKLGVETEINIAPWGVGTSFNIDTEHSLESGFSVRGALKSSTSMQMTTTTSSEYTTATAVELMGDLGTVFMGGAMNLLYGSTNVLDLVEDAGSYMYQVTTDVIFMPNGFETTYIYTRGYVENYLLPELAFLAETDTNINKSIDRWNYILNYEDSLRWATNIVDNFSFSGGGNSMTRSLETENSQAFVFEEELEIDSYFAETMGLEVAGFGLEGSSKVTASLSVGSSQEMTWTNSTTTSYTLMDDDDGDDYTVDVGSDPVYGTPVFNVIAGNSSCPYEEWRNEAGAVITTPRDKPGMTWLSASTVVNTHPDGVAELMTGLSNQSIIGTRTYYLSYVAASNINGAIIRINGEDADGSAPIPFELDTLGSDSALITLTRPEGSDIYEFDDILIKFAPECETNYAGVTQGYTASFSVHFARPCTDATIYQPTENWIVNTITGDTLTLVVEEYDLGQSYFDELIVQYSPMGDNTWYAVDTLDADTLRYYDFLYSQLQWDVSNRDDGIYDIRLQSRCLDGGLLNYMDAVRGVLDRQPPEVLGLPEPLDGVLNFNDAIALNFTEAINPVSVDPVNVIMTDLTTDEFITDFELSVSENRLVITPTLQNRFIENHMLGITLHGQQDLNGNPGEPVEWEFLVDRNPVTWSTYEYSHIAFQGEPEQITLQLNNTGSNAQPFQMSGSPNQNITPLPEWLTISPVEGALNPGGSFDIQIDVASDLNNGEYYETIYAVTPEGYEPLSLNVISMCPYPEWNFDFSQYEYSMNVTANLYNMSTLSTDIYDRVAAYVGDECRGWAQLEYIPALDDYQAFITIFSNEWSGEEVDFHLWDRTACAEYWQVDTTLIFVDGESSGSPAEPLVLNASGALGQMLDLNAGFTWVSLNLEATDMSVSQMLDGLDVTSGDRIIGQTSFAQYSDSSGWVGSLIDLDNRSMYQIDFEHNDILTHVGFPVFADTASLPIASGWNWISYLPAENMNVNNALSSMLNSSDDLIKSQTQYAQYLDGIGWLGSLNRMYPGMGYKLESFEGGILNYPLNEETTLARMNSIATELTDAPWTLDNVGTYQNNMTLTAILESDTLGVNNPVDAIAAFVGDEVRGVARPVYVPELDAYRVFLMIHGSQDEALRFDIWDSENDIMYHANQTWTFRSDEAIGTPHDPEIMTRTPLGVGDKGYIPDVYTLGQNYPNPFNPETKIGFGIPEDAEVTIQIYNILGQLVTTLVEGEMTAGYRYIKWSGTDHNYHQVPSGVYLVVMSTDSFRDVKKMVFLK